MSRVPRRLVVALAVSAALLTGAGVVILRDGDPAPVAAPSPRVRPVWPATPTTPAPDVTWTTYTGVRVPVSRSAGPRDLSGGRARGFAQTDLGAALAAVHMDLRASYLTTPAVYRATIREQVVGPDAGLMLRKVEAGYQQAVEAAGVAPGGPGGVGTATLHGFRVTRSAPTSRSVALLYSGPDAGGITVWWSTGHDLVWRAGDWRLVAPFDGSPASSTVAEDAAAGEDYLPFGGVPSP